MMITMSQLVYLYVILLFHLSAVYASIVYKLHGGQPLSGFNRVSRETHDSLLTSSEQKEILDLHNQLRRQEPAADMHRLVWNPALATEAQYWAEECQFKHGSSDIPINKTYDVLGQNLYYTTAGELNVTRAVLDWYAEKSGYHHETQKCSISMCGHYTQIVWAWTKELGCGYHVCRPLTKTDNSTLERAMYLACHYGPAGNYAMRPYRPGPACSECHGDTLWCDRQEPRGLCRDECSQTSADCACTSGCESGGVLQCDCSCVCPSGYSGLSCSQDCQNTHAYCGNQWKASRCEYKDHGPLVRQFCPSLCGLCGSETFSPGPQCMFTDQSTSFISETTEMIRTTPELNIISTDITTNSDDKTVTRDKDQINTETTETNILQITTPQLSKTTDQQQTSTADVSEIIKLTGVDTEPHQTYRTADVITTPSVYHTEIGQSTTTTKQSGKYTVKSTPNYSDKPDDNEISREDEELDVATAGSSNTTLWVVALVFIGIASVLSVVAIVGCVLVARKFQANKKQDRYRPPIALQSVLLSQSSMSSLKMPNKPRLMPINHHDDFAFPKKSRSSDIRDLSKISEGDLSTDETC